MVEIKRVVRLPADDSGLQNSIVRLNNRLIDANKEDKQRFFRREPVVIIHGKLSVLRYAMGTPGGLSVPKDAIALDYDAVDALNIKFQSDVKLTVRRAKATEVYRWLWNHPDLSVQISTKLGVLGAVLGTMGLMAGVLPILLG